MDKEEIKDFKSGFNYGKSFTDVFRIGNYLRSFVFIDLPVTEIK